MWSGKLIHTSEEKTDCWLVTFQWNICTKGDDVPESRSIIKFQAL